MWEKIVWLFVKFLYFVLMVLPTLNIVYPHKVIWEDKKKTKEALKKPCVVYSNHTGYSDGLFMLDCMRKYHLYTFVGKDWYEKKQLNWLFRNLRYIPLDRQQMDTTWLVKGKKILDQGESIYFFPEGHTSKDGNMLEFQPGFLMLAKQCKATLVPICLDRKIKPFHFFRVIIGTPQDLDLKGEGRPSVVLKERSEVCRQTVIRLKKKYGNPKFFADDVKNFVEE